MAHHASLCAELHADLDHVDGLDDACGPHATQATEDEGQGKGKGWTTAMRTLISRGHVVLTQVGSSPSTLLSPAMDCTPHPQRVLSPHGLHPCEIARIDPEIEHVG